MGERTVLRFLVSELNCAAAFADQVQALFQRYIQYLTNEGLFFYEF